MSEPLELPLAGARPERADARRNRLRILRAAGELIGERGLENVTLEQIAKRAGVAKGTVFHRFGSRAGLALALLDERERRLQHDLLAAPPPLGPGAAPGERLIAFLRALVDFTDANVDLLIISDHDEPGARYRTGAYAAWRLHTTRLLEALGFGDQSPGLAEIMLAPLSADLVRHRRREQDVSTAQIKDELEVLVRALLGVAKPDLATPRT